MANTIFRIQVAHKVRKNNNSDFAVMVFKLCSLLSRMSFLLNL